MPLPKVFIGSSNESRLIAEVLSEELRSVAEVTPWYNPSVFLPTHSYIGDLLVLPARFDFGVFLFEPDDRVVSRGKDGMAPRDNVVFEFGLFMQGLGLQRTFAVAPQGGVKILSDYSGFQLFDYQESKEIRELRAGLDKFRDDAAGEAVRGKFKQSVAAALAHRVSQMKDLIHRQGPIPPIARRVEEAASSATEVGSYLKSLVNDSVKRYGSASVLHLGLDMSAAWDILKEGFFQAELASQKQASQPPRKIIWRCLMIDPNSSIIKKASSDSVDVITATAKINNIREFMKANRTDLEASNVFFSCKTYRDLPVMHGFLVEGLALLWSMCGFADGKLNAAKTPYWRFTADDPGSPSAHPARTFAEWFEYQWQNATEI